MSEGDSRSLGEEPPLRGGGAKANAVKIRPVARSLFSGTTHHPASLINFRPIYRTELGAAYAADSLAFLKALPEQSVNAIITSPPYALHFKKEYGNVDKQD
jgi:site-specific DNA-methyltransferase (cytosine-N4-specific)